MKGQKLLSSEQIQEFHQNGFLLIEGFYDLKAEIEPIQLGIYKIIGILIDKYQLSILQKPFSPATFDLSYQQLIAYNRKIGGEVYDAVKQIPAFVRLLASEKHEQVFPQLRNTSLPGIAAGGYGIRIDNPGEEKFRAPWHQEYPAQFRSLDGLVFWSPLVDITPELGPVEFCVGSHKEGVFRVHTKDPKNPQKTGAYALVLENAEEIVARYPHATPLSHPGDLVIVDWLTLHASGVNQGQRSRWAMQFRYFNFNDPIGIKIGWQGSFAAGVSIQELHPELIAD